MRVSAHKKALAASSAARVFLSSNFPPKYSACFRRRRWRSHPLARGRFCEWLRSARRDTAHAGFNRIEFRAAELSLMMKRAAAYRQLKPLYGCYRMTGDKEEFLRGLESEIIRFEAAARELKRLGAVPLPATESMKAELTNLASEKGRLLVEYKAARSEV